MWSSSTRDGRRVSDDQWKEFISSLAVFLGGEREIVFSGGEPLLRKGVLELAAHASSLGMKTIMPTNGFLIDEAVAEAIGLSGMNEVFISLDSSEPSVHDSLRGMPGAFARAVAGAANLSKQSPTVRVGIICVISEANRATVPDLVRWVQKRRYLTGVYFQAVAKPFFAETGDDWRSSPEFSNLWPKDPAPMIAMIDELISMKRQGFPVHNDPMQLETFKLYFKGPDKRARSAPCHLGDNVLNVGPAGELSLCCFMEPLGNILTRRVGDLWDSPEAVEMRRRMRACALNCNNLVNCFFEEDGNA